MDPEPGRPALNLRIACLGTMFALAPVAVDVPLDSLQRYDGVTRLRLAGGGGSYAFIARGCEGRVIDRALVRFEEAGGSIEHRIGPGPVTLGLRAGRTRHRIGIPGDSLLFPEVPIGTVVENGYLNPFFSIDEAGGGFGAGWVVHDREFVTAGEHARKQPDHPMNDFSAHVRTGPLFAEHVLIQWMEGPALATGGYFTALAGGPLERAPDWVLRAGLGAGGPYEGAGLVLRLERVVDAGPSLDLTARLGLSGGDFAGGAAIGLSWALAHADRSWVTGEDWEGRPIHE